MSRGALPGRNPGRLACRWKSFVHVLCFDFHPHELFARGQILYRHIHKQTFPLIAEKVQ